MGGGHYAATGRAGEVNNGGEPLFRGVFFHSEWIMATGHYTWKVFFHSLG